MVRPPTGKESPHLKSDKQQDTIQKTILKLFCCTQPVATEIQSFLSNKQERSLFIVN